MIVVFIVFVELFMFNICFFVYFIYFVVDEGGIEDKVYTYKDLRKVKVYVEKER